MSDRVEDTLPTARDFVETTSIPLREWTKLGLPIGFFAASVHGPDRGPSMPWLSGPFLASACSAPWVPPTRGVVESRLAFMEAVLPDLQSRQNAAVDEHYRLRTAGLLAGFVLQLALLALVLVLAVLLPGAWCALSLLPMLAFPLFNLVVCPRMAASLRRREADLAFAAASSRAPWAPKPTLH